MQFSAQYILWPKKYQDQLAFVAVFIYTTLEMEGSHTAVIAYQLRLLPTLCKGSV